MTKVIFVYVLILLLAPYNAIGQEDTVNLFEISLEELMQVKIKTATGRDENLPEAPATIIVITEEDFIQRGYTSLDEVLLDVPGFDVMVTNGVNYLTAYQRGYRSNYTQRTLFMIDGKIDNHLWSHVADISRQYPLTNIQRVEILFGPVSVVYGPNAFLGIINIITKDPRNLKSEQTRTIANLFSGSYRTYGFDITNMGRKNNFSYSVTARLFKSDEADLSDKWEFSSNTFYSDKNIWGPILKLENAGRPYGEYFDPTHDYSISGKLDFKGFRFGGFFWKRGEGYGPYYAADRVQNNAFWDYTSTQVYIENDHDFSNTINSQTLLLFRKNFIGGTWTEAEPDWNDDRYSYISRTGWASYSKSWLLREDLSIDVNEKIHVNLGFRYELKELTKNYNIPGYWHAYSTDGIDTTLYGNAIGHSTDSVYHEPAAPLNYMPHNNLIYTNDVGGYIEGTYRTGIFKFTAGIRHDNNSLYGSSVNPRISWITTFNKNIVAKLVYGEAFQEPAPILLWGGWSGRTGRTDMKPEKARNLELIGMYSTKNVWMELSAFYSQYRNVNQADAPESRRTISGAETRFRFQLRNFVPRSKDIFTYCYYTYTRTSSSITYDHAEGKWIDKESGIGDIAPHKVQVGVNIPVRRFNLNVRGNYIAPRSLYSRNALAATDYQIDDYFLTNATLSYHRNQWAMGIKINNVFDTMYMLPGGELANAGDDFTARSKGYMNSLIPTPGRNFQVYFSVNF